MDHPKFSKLIKPLCSTTLDLPPSCIEFVPRSPEFFVVGTYNLQKDVVAGSLPQSRTGSLDLLKIIGDELTLIQTVSHPSAILDLHFLPSFSIFGVASSTGTISIYNFEEKDQSISHTVTHQAFDPTLLVLSFTWYPVHALQSGPLIAATLSNGSVHLLRFSNQFNAIESLNDSEPLNAHTLEAWTSAFSLPQVSGPLKIYSGGDDGMLRVVELGHLPTSARSEIQIVPTTSQTVFKGHDAGVTAILPLPVPRDSVKSGDLGDLLLTGSYDDYVRVYATNDTRLHAKNTLGKALAELKIGGGVWRLKFLDPPQQLKEGREVRLRILASCMHAGARVLEVTRTESDDEWRIEILGSVTIHESMCYGSDVQPVKEDSGEARLCVSTSFYDRLVCLWSFDPNQSGDSSDRETGLAR